MHRILMNAKSDEIVDHKNHKKNDNRKCNLRIGNKSNNAMNAHIRSDNTSGTTGVCFNKRDDGWDAYIHIDGKKLFLGTFDKIMDAIKERHKAEEKYFKEWSYMNSIGKYNNDTNELNNEEEVS